MRSMHKAVALAIVMTVCGPATAQDAYSDAEVAFVTAKLMEGEFARTDAMCGKSRAARNALKDGLAQFQAANPGYATGLALQSPRPEVVAAMERERASQAKAFAMMAPMLERMPPDMLCGSVGSERAGFSFDKRVALMREHLARPPAPSPVVDTTPLTTLAPTEVNQVVGIVLQHPDVAMYLHPDAPGRVPVTVALAAPYERAAIELSLYGAAVKTARAQAPQAVQLTLEPRGDHCKARVRYVPEGIHGFVDLERVDGAWRATGAQILE